MNIDNGNLQFNRYQTGTIGNARPENVAANNTQTASGNAALAQAQEGQTFTGRIVDVNAGDDSDGWKYDAAGADGGSGEPQYG